MTSGAIMHVSDEYVERAKTWFAMIHTTSPFFPILMSIEQAIKYLVENGQEQFNKAIAAVEVFKEKVKNTCFNVYTIDDPTRVSIESELEGSVVADYLEINDIYPEMIYGNRVVLIVTPFNYDKLENVAKCLIEIDTGKTHGFPIGHPVRKESKYNRHRGSGTRAGKEFVGIKELVFGKDFMKVEIEDAVGHIAYKEVGMYPPGVPDIYSGDIITEEDVEYLKERVDSLFGLLDGKLLVVQENE
jgi:arginine/lysine/ornithine decarboxylase